MENIVKQIQLVALVIILVSTVIAFGQEMYQMILVQRVTLADLLLLFLYLDIEKVKVDQPKLLFALVSSDTSLAQKQ